MKLFWAYLKHKRLTLLMLLLFFAVFLATYRLYGLTFAEAVYPAVICLPVGAGFAAAGFFRFRRRHEQLRRVQTPAEALLCSLPPAESIGEQDYQAIIVLLRELNEAQREQFAAHSRDMMEYYTTWAHQIKTPLASMRLALQNEDTPLARQLNRELFRTEQYVGMVMAYLRLDEGAGDYVFRACRLDELLRQSIRRFSAEVIERRLRLDFRPTGLTVLTDEKWLGFVLEQLLSNALKYTREGGIRIYSDGPDALLIEDTGIGIAPEDLPRIFECGYTGLNGRYDKRASGIGLYLSRRICDRLAIRLSAVSAVGQGTAMRLTFERREFMGD